MKKALLTDLTLTNKTTGAKVVFAKGTPLTLSFNPARLSRVVCTHADGNTFAIRAVNAKKYFGAPFMATPSEKTLMKWSDDGIAKSVTGARVEPDGYGPDGSPSWLLALGLI